MGQRSNSLLVVWHDIELFAIAPTKSGLVYAAGPAYWYKLESSSSFLVKKLSCFSYFLLLLATDDTSSTIRMRRLTMLVFVALMIAAFFRRFCFGVLPRYASGRIRYESDCLGVLGPFGLR